MRKGQTKANTYVNWAEKFRGYLPLSPFFIKNQQKLDDTLYNKITFVQLHD